MERLRTGRRSIRLGAECSGLERRELMSYVPTASAYRVNQVTEGGQYDAKSASAPDGVTTVVWTDFGLDSDGKGIYARRLDAQGNPLGAQFRVNSTTAGDQEYHNVVADGQGNVLVFWQDHPAGTSSTTMYYQRYDAQGAKVGGNTALPGGTDLGYYTRIFMRSDGSFAVVARDLYTAGLVHVRGYSAAGSPTYSADLTLSRPGWDFDFSLTEPPSAATGDGLVLTWSESRTRAIPDVGTRFDGRVWARRLDADGHAIGTDILVASRDAEVDYQAAQNLKPSVIGLSDGGFLVSWYDYGPGGSAYVGRRYNASGAAQGQLITFSPTSNASYGHGDTVTLAELKDGRLVAAAVQETAFEADTSDFRVFDRDGNPVTPRVPMPSVTAYYLGALRVAATGGSTFLVTWGDQANPPYNGEVYTQGFANVATVAFAASTMQVGESAGVATITLVRDGDLSAAASVGFETASESATGGSDYTAAGGVATFAPGSSTATVSIPILRDAEVEGNETFLVTLHSPVGVAFGDVASLRVTIVDDPNGTAGPTLPNVYISRGPGGLWAWTAGVGLTQLNPNAPENLAVAADGTLYVDFGAFGLWTWAGGDFVQLNAANPENLMIAPDKSLYVDYGPYGLWRRDASGFAQLNGANPEGFAAAADGTLYVDFGPYGLWRRDAAGIVQINGADPEGLAVVPDGTLYVDFGPYGFWRRDASGIVKVNGANPEGMTAAADGSVFVDFGAFGLWRWSGGFAQINGANAEGMAAGADGSIYIDFGSFGLWTWTGAGFAKINNADPQGLRTGRDGFLYIDFGPHGVWRRSLAGQFESIDPTDPRSIAG